MSKIIKQFDGYLKSYGVQGEKYIDSEAFYNNATILKNNYQDMTFKNGYNFETTEMTRAKLIEEVNQWLLLGCNCLDSLFRGYYALEMSEVFSEIPELKDDKVGYIFSKEMLKYMEFYNRLVTVIALRTQYGKKPIKDNLNSIDDKFVANLLYFYSFTYKGMLSDFVNKMFDYTREKYMHRVSEEQKADVQLKLKKMGIADITHGLGNMASVYVLQDYRQFLFHFKNA